MIESTYPDHLTVGDRDVYVSPRGNKVLLACERRPRKSAGGLELPEKNAGFVASARVLAVSTLASRIVAPGDRVIYHRTNALPSSCRFQDADPDADRYSEIVFVDVDDVICQVDHGVRFDG